MDGTIYRMRMAATAFAVLVVLGVLFFIGDEDQVAGAAVSMGFTREAPVIRPQSPERVTRSERPAMDRPSEFTPDEDLIDDTQGLSTDGFDTDGIDTGGFDTDGLEPEPELDPEPDAAPAIDTTVEYAIVDGDGGEY